MAVEIQRRLFTTGDFHRMAEADIFAAGDRVELIEGEVVEMSPIGLAHANCVRRLTNVIAQRMGDQVLLDVQNPLRLGALSEPQPDLMLLRDRGDGYENGLPEAAEVLLLIEVSDRSLSFDRDVKLPLYSEHGIPEVWLVDLVSSAVEVHRQPSGRSYVESRRMTRGDRLAAGLAPQVVLEVDEILGGL